MISSFSVSAIASVCIAIKAPSAFDSVLIATQTKTTGVIKMSVKDCKLESHKSAFCHVVVHEDGVNLVSYETSVCQIILSSDRTTGRVLCNGNYSRSTIKHIGWFTREFTGNNLYSEIISVLKAAEKKNKNGACIEYISVPLSFAEIARCSHRINWYKEEGTRFYKYSGSPNYDKLFYGYSNFKATNL